MISELTEVSEAEFLGRLGAVCRGRRLEQLTTRLWELKAWMADDLATLDAELDRLPRGASVVRRSAQHLLDLPGKHLRPMCVALAAKLGTGFGAAARDLAVAVELIHNATLLHDDVVDLGERRRGAPAARVIYGNAAAIFAGDWLLVAALKRVHRAGLPHLLDGALATIEEMIGAEALELESRGRLDPDPARYFRIVHGKTAALFRWAMAAGAEAGGLPNDQGRALESYGEELGVAFQLVDDLLDFTGDPAAIGKGLFSDLREGKATYPLLVALERDAELAPLVESILSRPPNALPPPLCARVLRALDATGALRDSSALAHAKARAAISCLDAIPQGPGRNHLVTLAEAIVHRRR